MSRCSTYYTILCSNLYDPALELLWRGFYCTVSQDNLKTKPKNFFCKESHWKFFSANSVMDTAANKDSGFAWIVLIASFMGHFFQYGIVWTVGYFYVIFLEHFDGSKAAVALIASLNTATYYCIGMCAIVQIIYIWKYCKDIALVCLSRANIWNFYQHLCLVIL